MLSLLTSLSLAIYFKGSEYKTRLSNTDELTNIAEPIADEIINKLKDATTAAGSAGLKQKADAIKKSVAEASAGGVAGFAGPIGNKERKNEKRRTYAGN